MSDKKRDPIAFTLVFQFLTASVIGIYALLHGFHMPNVVAFWPNFLAMMVLYGFGNIFIFSALGVMEASEFTIIFALRSLWTVLVAVFFFHESFVFLQIIGSLCIFMSIMLISYKKHTVRATKGTVYALLASLCFGLAFANDAYLVRHFDVASYQCISFFLTGLLLIPMYSFSLKKIKFLFSRKRFSQILLLSTTYGISVVTALLAYKYSSHAAEIASLSQTTTIVTVVLAMLFLKETAGLFKKIISVSVAFIGILLIH